MRSGRLPGWTTNDFWNGDIMDNFAATNYPVTLHLRANKIQAPGWMDVTSKVKSLAAGGQSVVLVDNGLTGCDPGSNTVKQLSVTFRSGRGQTTIAAEEGKTLALPAHADIVQARYGVLTGHQISVNVPPDTSFYHYIVVENIPDGPWTLQKAWQADKNGKVIRKFPVN